MEVGTKRREEGTMKRSIPGQGFRGCSSSPIIFTGITSRSLRLRPTSAQWRKRRQQQRKSYSAATNMLRTIFLMNLMEETPDGSPSLASLDGCNLCFETEADGPEEVSACADAAAAVPLQPGVRRLRKDPVSRAHPQSRTLA